jgi:hypothetical protein
MDMRTEVRPRGEIAGYVTRVDRGRKWVVFVITAGGKEYIFKIPKGDAQHFGVKYPLHTLVLYETGAVLKAISRASAPQVLYETGLVVKIVTNPSTSQILQGVAWTEGGDTPS